ncbi:MAG TPA: branched-chain amino acid aminotransferase [Propionibacteriaceae bacterium]|nr:branched-chain amino acid aminotransferase [Propionibacteriaceae bacterium]
MTLAFPLVAHPSPALGAVIEERLADPGFGRYFTDHMAVATWREGRGWGEDSTCPYAPFAMDPAGAVLHYAQEVFEGLKAYRHADGSVWLFRPEMNARRLIRSAERLGLPTLPEEDFLTSVRNLVTADARWVPNGDGEDSLYLRPFMFADESFLGVRAAQTVKYAVIASPVGPYFPSGVKPVDIWITTTYSRAGTGGTGAAKCGGNYASSLVAQKEAYEHGCSQVLFTDAATHSWLEELGGMNIFLVTDDGKLLTPPTSGTILDGITRDSILTLAPELGLGAEVRPVALGELVDGVASGRIVEAFACGTAAVVTPIGRFHSEDADPLFVTQQQGTATMAIRNRLLDIQYGRGDDPYGWGQRVC